MKRLRQHADARASCGTHQPGQDHDRPRNQPGSHEIFGLLVPAGKGSTFEKNARNLLACQILMSISGVGAITATSFMTAIEEPDNFKNGDPYQSGLLMETKLVRRTSNRRTISNDTT